MATNNATLSNAPTASSSFFTGSVANGPWFVIITPKTTSTIVPPTYTISCVAPRNSAPSRK
jgi:hypothetical protein